MNLDDLRARCSVVPSSECWEWQGARSRGYGQVWSDGRTVSTHRVAYHLHYGPIPKGLCICHRCDNTLCCNPAHLFLGTHQQNMDDMAAKGRAPKGDQHGRAKLTEEEVLSIRKDTRSLRNIASEYGVHTSSVHRIKQGTQRRHLGGDSP